MFFGRPVREYVRVGGLHLEYCSLTQKINKINK